MPHVSSTDQDVEQNDERGHDELYGDTVPWFEGVVDPADFVRRFESTRLARFETGGITKGYVRGLATRRLLHEVDRLGRDPVDVRVIDAGCGLGDLSMYLAAKGLTVYGIDISSVACEKAQRYAERLPTMGRCEFLPASLEQIPLKAGSVDFVIGHAALHHFIKYDGVAPELARVVRPGGLGFFADSWGENPAYTLFHDRDKMARLGDVRLTKPLVERFFSPFFSVTLVPTDWFTMLDKLWERSAREETRLARTLSRASRRVDNSLPHRSRLFLWLAGAVMTQIARQ
jgi:ubiquinone/menaquinone biosynthesis C-methylase UbiE